ncbi:MAG: sulfatase-like hydrolase/transferase [Rikenellaceae bacterium]
MNHLLRNAILAGTLLPAAAAAAAAERPNIILFLTDDQAFNTIAAWGNNQIKSPNLDRLAQSGVSFKNHYATTSISMASRAIVMTGMYEYKTGCNFLVGGLPTESFERSYPMVLRESGYYTGFAGKFGFAVTDDRSTGDKHNSYDLLPVDEFDEWGGGVVQTNYETKKNKYIAKYADKYPHSTRAYGAFGCDFIENASKSGKPFSLSISFKAPHSPMTPDPMFDDVYKGVIFEQPYNMGERGDDLLPTQAKMGRQFLYYFDDWYADGRMQEYYRRYYQLIYGVDYAVGMILDKLEESGLDKNTIIIFTSDNGYSQGSRNLGGKVLPYEWASRTPLIIVDPRERKSAGKSVDIPTGNIDIAPTILNYAGIQVPQNMDGEALGTLVKNQKSKFRDNIALINVWGTPHCYSLSVVSRQTKYIYWNFAESLEPAEELYHVDSDPYEMENLAGIKSYSKELEKMRKLYDEHLERWERECIKDTTRPYYQLPKVLDRHLPWSERKKYIPEVAWDQFDKLLKIIGYEGAQDDYEAIIKAKGLPVNKPNKNK